MLKKLLNNLTESQATAVMTDAPAALVLAGAGSGKTTVVTKRIAYLISQKKVHPSSILVITFTRKAAQELKTRIEGIGINTRGMWIGTFHAISYKMLMQFGETLGYKTSELITVIDQTDKLAIEQEAIKKCLWEGRQKEYRASVSDLACKLQNFADYDFENQRLFQEYFNILKRNNAVDFDLLLLEVHELFKKNKKCLEYYHNKFKYIFVDEYQDTNYSQYSLHERLQPDNLFCVGDTDQGIYSFRGAQLEIILNFQKKHSNAQIVKLEECFRCGKSIVDAANNVIEHNKMRLDKKLISATSYESEVFNKCSENFNFADYISECLFSEPLEEIAIISRTHRSLDFAEELLKESGLDYVRVKGAENNSLERCIINSCRLVSNEFDGIAEINLNFLLGSSKTKDIRSKFIPDAKINRLIEFIDRKFQVQNYHESKDFLDSIKGKTIKETFEFCQLRDMHSCLEKRQKDKITLLTAHAAKGLEWNTVFIINCDQNIFPNKRAVKEGQLEEERRLFYVAATRARKRLFFLHYKEPSQFINETGV